MAASIVALHEADPSDTAICTLRVQLPLAVSEAGVKTVADWDPVYRLCALLTSTAKDRDKDVHVTLSQVWPPHVLEVYVKHDSSEAHRFTLPRNIGDSGSLSAPPGVPPLHAAAAP